MEKSLKKTKLVNLEDDIRKMWSETRIWESDARDEKGEKWFVTFPFPYMNGKLHLGHLFSFTKADYIIGYKKLKGVHTLFPFGFHATGMPIKACADRLTAEFNAPADEEQIEEAVQATEVTNEPKTTFKGAKTKLKSKTGNGTQYEIMQAMGIPEDEIHKFQDAHYWVKYFPPLAKEDLIQFGGKIDWRRSFVTTDLNPYYDSFIRWQFIRLKESGYVKFGTRATVYSPKDGQACADHDRSTGEGLGPQEYVVIKMRVKDTSALPDRVASALEEHKDRVYLGAATLRAETMYGQTNCWALPTGEYGAYLMKNGDVLVSGARAIRNMFFQGLVAEKDGEPHCLVDGILGKELFGVELAAPLTPYTSVFVLPLLTIKLDKGTGIVTSVPSDAPDDWAAYRDMQENRNGIAEKHGVKSEWCANPTLPVIKIPQMIEKDGELHDTIACAIDLCEQMGIKSQLDKAKLAQAKQKAYLDGFYKGTMYLEEVRKLGATTLITLAGESIELEGMPVAKAKEVMRDALCESGDAFVYSEPEGTVISRSGDECVVTLMDQWYLDYGAEEWKAAIKRCLVAMDLYSDEIRAQFDKAADWLSQWACSRSFGLGTRIPWDEKFLIESLSDSTIYMAYYTVAHFLHEGSLDGSTRGSAMVEPEAMTPEIWSAILLGDFSGVTDACPIPRETIEAMRKEFEYWYPVDLRVSGKDLIQNHLTMFLYNHTAIWPDKILDNVRGQEGWAESKWPKGVRTNGHIQIDNQKMSKSTGNFLTGTEAMDTYGVDALRFALGEAGDGMEDANFVRDAAEQAVLKLGNQLEWIETMVSNASNLRHGDLTLFDRVFLGQMHFTLGEVDRAYERMLFRGAIKVGFHDLQSVRDKYRTAVGGDEHMHVECVKTFARVQATCLAPICSFWAEHVHSAVLGGEGSIFAAGWPVVPGTVEQHELAIVQSAYLDNLITVTKRKNKGKKKVAPTSFTIVVAKAWHEWQKVALATLRQCFDADTKTFTEDPKALVRAIAQDDEATKAALKVKMFLPFMAMKQRQATTQGVYAIAENQPFDEMETLKINAEFLAAQFSVENVETVYSDDVADEKLKTVLKKQTPSPGEPVAVPN
ncbi:Leucyl-tRNA synthetase, class Ia, archaeal/eukaryotic cytosolic [Carpediemonas membranifera]|uniref:leucine--tRNA ligase n=1 Tax=Carpediemonas membranifera TaxID=201153 RepID=A0A8J6E2E7_9EUKA|nr:Leucyl-tRNA synthetase, class Ia, archaeal/eukaryotic cytosolic [Carpediemonas membranifera]|eukprot:KAG9397539.1 Leucyl-tRNA synthetase, class Ia, archaeal/eukaryotic cytosolic [Carpediemonas membranifera]